MRAPVRRRRPILLPLLAAVLQFAVSPPAPAAADAHTPYPILFVTQVPTAAFQHVASAFGAHQTSIQQAPRGGDLWIRHPDGTLRNLTAEAGLGLPGAQDGAKAIAVRQPAVHWSGTKALFAMVVGAPSRQYEVTSHRWQLYEVSGLAPGQTVSITRVACQPEGYDNLAPAYASDGQILFVSSRPRSGLAHHHPQRDEYESAPIDSGLWKLDPASCSFRIVEHAPSGVTYPSIDSAGRVVFTKWDHLLRDQQADSDTFANGPYGSFDYDSESQLAPPAVHSRVEHFPELRRRIYSLAPGQGFDGASTAADYPFADHTFNHFFPWMMNQDGSEEETLNHLGRHELGGSYSEGSFRADRDLADTASSAGRFNGGGDFLYGSGGMFHLREDPTLPGRFWGVRAPEFATATAGDLVLLDSPAGRNAEHVRLGLVAAKETWGGRFRNPLPLSDGGLVVSFTPHVGELTRGGTSASPTYDYAFRLRTFSGTSGPGAFLTPGLAKSIQYWDPDQRVSWSGALWELDPVEVRPRPVPPATRAPRLPAPERSVLEAAGVDEDLLRNWLHRRGLALVVARDVTSRDRADEQQPFNLAVAGTSKATIGVPGAEVYDVTHLQLFQGDQIRGYANGKPPQQGGAVRPGRRVLAVPMHDDAARLAMNAHLTADPPASSSIAADGSVAVFVPAGRAMTWQLVNAARTGWDRVVVRERNWISFRAGETRVCASCHGVNVVDQAGRPAPENAPQALAALLAQWRPVVRDFCPESGGTGTWSFAGVPFGAWEDGRRYRIQTCQGGNGCCDGLPATETEEASGPVLTSTPAAPPPTSVPQPIATARPPATPTAAPPAPTATPVRVPTPVPTRVPEETPPSAPAPVPTAVPSTCMGRAVTIRGTPGDDVIAGTKRADVIHALGGDDVVDGKGGDDVICGGEGADLLRGGKGNDVLDGGPGANVLEGGAGRDTLLGREGDDRLSGGAGNDALLGGPGSDVLRGEAGNDRLEGWESNDLLDGGAGNDVLLGGDGDDRLSGGRGRDRLEGGPGADACAGGAGRNVVVECE